MKKIVAATLACLIVTGLSGCGDEQATPSIDTASSSEPSSAVSNYFNGVDIPYQLYTTPGSSLVVIGTNESGEQKAAVQVQVSFLKDGSVVASETDSYRQVANGKKMAFSFPLPDDYDDMQVTFTTSEDSPESIEDLSANLQTSANRETDGVAVICKNTGETEMNFIKLQVVYYQKNKVVGCERTVTTEALPAGSEISLKAPLPQTESGAEISFDQYEVVPAEVLRTDTTE